MLISYVVYSYNRGPFLLNCVLSILRHANAKKIIVYDDFSDCEITRNILRMMSEHALIEVVTPREEGFGYHGGLYDNMNDVLYNRVDDQFALFLQDDMQLVRSITTPEITDFIRLMQKESIQFLYVSFLKGENRARDNLELSVHGHHLKYYKRTPTSSNSQGVCADVGLMDLRMLRAMKWYWGKDRFEHIHRARRHQSSAAILALPFTMFLPSPSSHKYRSSGFFRLLAEKACKVGFYPFDDMPESVETVFFQKGVRALPFAEDWLTADSAPRSKGQFCFSDASKRNHITRALFYLDNRFKPFR